MRKVLLAGNWKMNKSVRDLDAYFDALQQALGSQASTIAQKVDICIAPAFTLLAPCRQKIAGRPILLAAQNAHFAQDGAFTGEVSLKMLQDIPVDLVILGHSERRQYFNETDEDVGKKVDACVAQSLVPILCVGETLDERKANKTFEVVKRQVLVALKGQAPSLQPHQIVIAYEPVWAIGTGVTATDEQAQEVHAFIRGLLTEKFGQKTSEGIRILYGGSAKADNIVGLLNQKDIDGGLVGGASLKPDEFARMILSGLRKV